MPAAGSVRPAPNDTTRGDTKATEEGGDAKIWWWLPALIFRGSANKRGEILSIHALTAAAGRLVDVGESQAETIRGIFFGYRQRALRMQPPLRQSHSCLPHHLVHS